MRGVNHPTPTGTELRADDLAQRGRHSIQVDGTGRGLRRQVEVLEDG